MGGTDFGVLLPDGKIFYCHNSKDPFLFDLLENDTVFAPGDENIQGCVAPGLLLDGRLILIGGTDQEIYGPGTQLVKTFNPSDGSWEELQQMLDYRWYPSMAQLPGGELLVVGGGGLDNPIRVNTSEIYDPYNQTVEQVGDIEVGNEVSPIVLLYSGEVLMTHRPPQLFNPATKEWRPAADFVQSNRLPNGDHSDHELVLLPDGRAVAVGYKSFNPPDFGHFIEIYAPNSDSWSLGANFLPIRSRAKTVLLPDKKILVMGGEKENLNDPTPTNQWGYMKLTDLYDPYEDSWRRLDELHIAREYHCTTILVPDGRVIAAGGEGAPGNEPNLSVIEAFEPPYLFKGVRPEIVNLEQTEFRRGETIEFNIEKTNAPTSIILMSLQSVTHFMNTGNNRYLELEFTQIGNHISATVPVDSLAALPGYYMLMTMVDDIPSVAEIVKLEKEAVVTETEHHTFVSGWVQVFPNPASTILNLAFENAKTRKLTVFNTKGKVLKQYLATGPVFQISVEDMPSGIYFLEIREGEKRLVKRLVKN